MSLPDPNPRVLMTPVQFEEIEELESGKLTTLVTLRIRLRKEGVEEAKKS